MPKCGTIDKRYLHECPKCHSHNVDYMTRIIGYLKRVSNFSEARQAEARKRYYATKDKMWYIPPAHLKRQYIIDETAPPQTGAVSFFAQRNLSGMRASAKWKEILIIQIIDTDVRFFLYFCILKTKKIRDTSWTKYQQYIISFRNTNTC